MTGSFLCPRCGARAPKSTASADRLRAAENEMAQASLRQRALAQLHSRLANTLLGAPEV